MHKPLILPSLHAHGSDPRTEPRRITKGMQQWFRGFAPVLTHLGLSTMCGLCHQVLPVTSQAWRHWGECPGKVAVAESLIQPVIKTPTGLDWIVGSQRRPRVELRAHEMEWIRQFADVGLWLELGLHCNRCHTPLSGLNSDADPVYSVACSCREFIGSNREYVAPAKVSIH